MNLFIKNTKPVSFVPVSVWFVLFCSFSLQLMWYSVFEKPQIKLEALPPAPDISFARLIGLDDQITTAKMAMLWLQAFDNQPGISIPLKELDYDRVIEWLDLILSLDEKAQYPLLAAIRFYAEVPDKQKQEKMIQFVIKKFIEDPDTRWPFMAHAVYIAKHRVKNMQLALECAHLLRLYAKGKNVPDWAKQMEIFVLEDMGELESAKILIGGLLESGELNDSHQRFFLEKKLLEIEQRQ